MIVKAVWSTNDWPNDTNGKPENGFHRIEFEEDPKTIYLDAAEIQKTERTVQMQYRLPALKFLE